MKKKSTQQQKLGKDHNKSVLFSSGFLVFMMTFSLNEHCRHGDFNTAAVVYQYHSNCYDPSFIIIHLFNETSRCKSNRLSLETTFFFVFFLTIGDWCIYKTITQESKVWSFYCNLKMQTCSFMTPIAAFETHFFICSKLNAQ